MNLHLPWRAVSRDELEISGQRVIKDAKGVEIALVQFDEDAEELVRRVNGWDKLCEQGRDASALLREAEMEIEHLAGYVPDDVQRDALIDDMKTCSLKLFNLTRETT